MGIEDKLPSGVLLTTVEGVIGWLRQASFWPATMGLACCAIEMMAAGASTYDWARFGFEVPSASPRRADMMIVAGTVVRKMVPIIKTLYEQMPDPKFVIAVGSCACSGEVYRGCHCQLDGIDSIIPVDVYIPGCAARPDAIVHGVAKLLAKLSK